MVISRVLFTFITLDCPSEFGEIDVLRFLRWVSCSPEHATFSAVYILRTPLLIRGYNIGRLFAFPKQQFFLDSAWSKLCYKISCFLINVLKACTSRNPFLSINSKLGLKVNVLILPGYNFFYHDRSFLNIDSESKNLHTQTVEELPRLYSYSIFMTVLRSTGESNPPL